MRFYSHPPVDLSSSNLRSGPDFHQTSHDETKQTAPKGGREPPRLGRAVQYPAVQGERCPPGEARTRSRKLGCEQQETGGETSCIVRLCMLLCYGTDVHMYIHTYIQHSLAKGSGSSVPCAGGRILVERRVLFTSVRRRGFLQCWLRWDAGQTNAMPCQLA
jgi:hypothetical protein